MKLIFISSLKIGLEPKGCSVKTKKVKDVCSGFDTSIDN